MRHILRLVVALPLLALSPAGAAAEPAKARELIEGLLGRAAEAAAHSAS